MKVHIFGASGSGTTTLGRALSDRLDWQHLDADNYYWEKTNPPFQVKIPIEKRNINLKRDFLKHSNCIVSGSMVSWGMEWSSAFDLAVFLHIPAKIRINRLESREQERYGELLDSDPKAISDSKAFIDWAKRYDDPKFVGRSISQHENWIKQLECKVLRLEGDLTTAHRLQGIIQIIEDMKAH